MDIPLLLTKIRMPPSRPVGSRVVRPHLLARLDEGRRRGCRLILVSAPAGFGKTTVISEWLHQQSTKAAWVSIDANDNDAVRFLSYIVAACQTVLPQVGETAQSLLQAAQPMETVLTSLINDLAAASEPLWIVLDDYHLISLPPIHNALAYMLEHLPPDIHLIVVTRADPSLPLARLRACGELTELRASDLRFTMAEAATFLSQVMELHLSASDMAALEAHTEGWIAGLQLAAISLQNRADAPAFIRAFTGSNRHIVDYLVEEVLNQQTPDVQAFLLQTSILDGLTGQLCNALTGRQDGAAQLDALERANLFLMPLDDERHWYRYHHLFADLLHLRLQQTTSVEAIAALHTRAAQWHAEQRLTPEAMRHALTAAQDTQDYALVEQLMTRTASRALRRGEITTLRHWLESIPESERRARRSFAFFYAYVQLLTGQLESVESWLQAAETGQVSAEAVEPQDFQVALAALRTLLVAYQGDVARTIELGQSVLAHMTENYIMQRGIVALSLGDAYRWSGDFAAAIQVYTQSVDHSQRAQNLNTVINAHHNWAEVRLALGQLRQTEAHYASVRRFAESLPLRSRPPVIGMLDLGEAWLAYERNELETAMRLWQAGQVYVELDGLLEAHQLGLRLRLARGESVEAEVQAESIAQLVRSRNAPYLRMLAADNQVRFLAAQVDHSLLETWAAALEHDRAATIWPLYVQFLADRALARAWLALGQPERSLAQLNTLRRQAEEFSWYGEVINVALLQARAHAALGATAQAHLALQRALSLAAPEGYVRTFVDEGSVIRCLLKETRIHQGKQPDPEMPALETYVTALLEAFEKGAQPVMETLPHSPASTQPFVEPLSDREQDVLRLIVADRTNAEIADALVVAVSTVKTHINHIYSKLGAHTREEAIDHARKLGLH